jgi:hypothetical protein
VFLFFLRYYVNTWTKESVWTFPSAPASEHPGLLPTPGEHPSAQGTSAPAGYNIPPGDHGIPTPDPTPGSATQPTHANSGYFVAPSGHEGVVPSQAPDGSQFSPPSGEGAEGDRGLFHHHHDQQDQDRGLGKMAMGVLMGGALGKVFGDQKDKFKIFGFGGNSNPAPPPPPEHHGFSSFIGGVGSAAGAATAAAGAATAVSAAAVTIQGHHQTSQPAPVVAPVPTQQPPPQQYHNYAPPPQQHHNYAPSPQQHQYYAPPPQQPPQMNYHQNYAPQPQGAPAQAFFGGMVSTVGGGGGEPLHILSANYGGVDVTEKVKERIKDNRIDFNDSGSADPFNEVSSSL